MSWAEAMIISAISTVVIVTDETTWFEIWAGFVAGVRMLTRWTRRRRRPDWTPS